MSDDSHETHVKRLSIRTTQSNYLKLLEVAKERGWVNAQGHPNLSRTLNYIIDKFQRKK